MTGRSLPPKDIVVRASLAGEEYQLQTFPNEYRSLMHLIYDRLVTEDFGECLGMGKCGTCLVKIVEKKQEPTSYDRNGDVNLLKAGCFDENVRLSCQLMIDEKINGLAVEILI